MRQHLKAHKTLAFSLLEVMVGIGLAGGLVLLILLLSTTALRTDQKVGDKQIAAAVAESQLDLLSGAVAVKDSPARQQFWSSPDGTYTGSGSISKVRSNGTDYTLRYRVETITTPGGSTLNSGSGGNRLRQVTLLLSWWSDKDTPGEDSHSGYGDLFIRRTRILRESHVRF